MGHMTSVMESVYQQMRAIESDHRRPQEIRIGQLDWYDLLSQPESRYAVSIYADPVTLLGLPVKRLPVARAISVI